MRNTTTDEILQDVSSTSNKITSSLPPLVSTNENISAFRPTNQKSMTSQSTNNSLSSAFQPINKSSNTISPPTKSAVGKITSFNVDKDLSVSDIIGKRCFNAHILISRSCIYTVIIWMRDSSWICQCPNKSFMSVILFYKYGNLQTFPVTISNLRKTYRLTL